ncbi:MAG: TldD/PmbA family protein [Dehalococcoidia bacterium]|nr:TldD/PmbA family protein [Dehalococcoidia bacterium]
MRDVIESALRGHEADYIEIRLEEGETSRLIYRGSELEDVGRTTFLGGNVRAVVKGGWGFSTFNGVDDLRARVIQAVQQARLVGHEETHFAETEPVVDIVEPYLKGDPFAVPLAHKKELLDGYNEILLSTPGLQTSQVIYRDLRRKVTMATSQGTYIEQGKVDVVARFTGIATRDGDVQQASLSTGRLGDFSFLESLHDEVRRVADRAVELLSAAKVRSGEYTVVLDPILAGVFAHEAFGHLSEADHIYENEHLRDIMSLGRRFAGPHLNIADGAAVPGLRGSYKYDDEGVPAARTDLIREGVLVGRLHSRETASKMGERLTGNARAINYRHEPIVRMTNTCIEPGEATLEDLLSGIKEGVYAQDWYGGTTSMEMFTFSSGGARMIREGKLAEPLRGIVLTGNVFATLENVDAVGNDLYWSQGGGCGKGGQSPLPVSSGSPHIRIRRCVVGGR